jgi:hypothetical protein
MVFSSNNKRKTRSNDFVYDFCIQFLYFIQMSFDLLDLKVGTKYSHILPCQDWVLCWTLYFKKEKKLVMSIGVSIFRILRSMAQEV